MKSEQIDQLATALSKAQGEFQPAVFDKVNPHFKSGYASLTSVMNSVRDALTKNGLSISHSIIENDGKIALETVLMHSSGQYFGGVMPLLVDKNNMQGLGSAVSYAKRYAVSAMLAVVSDEDDDGNAVSGKNAPAAKPGSNASKLAANMDNDPFFAPKVTAPPVADPIADYTVKVGPAAGKKIAQIPNLKALVATLKAEAQASKAKLSGEWTEFFARADEYLGRDDFFNFAG